MKTIFITGYGNAYYENIYEHITPQGFLEKPIQYNILNFFIKQPENEYKEKTAKLKISRDRREFCVKVNNKLPFKQ
jgi:hypothetical protein